MSTLESTITARLRAAADAVPVEPDLDRVTAEVHTVQLVEDASAAARRRWLLPALASAAAIVVGIAWVGVGEEAGPVAAAPVPVGAPAPGAHVAAVADPPSWFDATDATRSGGRRQGEWVASAIGMPDGDGFAAPILVAAFRGVSHDLSLSQQIDVDGTERRVHEIGDWRVVFSHGEPTVAASGAVDLDVLTEVLDGAEALDVDGRLTVHLGDLPDGYEEIVPPQTLGEDVVVRHTLASSDGTVAIHESSDWVHPLLAAVGAGTGIRRVDIDGTVGWSGTTDTAYGELTFVTWSPAPGVVFEAVAADGARTVDELVDLARRTTVERV